MRDRIIECNKYNFISILEVKARKAVNEHATFYVKGHVAAENDDYVLRSSERQDVTYTALDSEGRKELFSGLVCDVKLRNENEMRILTVESASRSILMDDEPQIRTFQNPTMTYREVTDNMNVSEEYNFLWPKDGDRRIGSMMVQYKETDWQYAIRLAGRLGTVVVADYLLDKPYISVGMPKRAPKQGIEAISYEVKKDVCQYRDNNTNERFAERDAIYYVVRSREIYDLCDPITFLGLPLYVYAIDTVYDGQQLEHYYTLKEAEGFFTPELFNDDLIGASLRGSVLDIQEDKVRVRIEGDISQTEYKWFPYASPFTQPDGYGWYFMPEVGDEVRLQFPSVKEDEPYVSSAVHVTHGHRENPETKFIRTIYGQIIQFDPEQILIDDGAGSRISLHVETGISMDTDKFLIIGAKSNIIASAEGRIILSGGGGVVMQKDTSVVNIDDAIDISSDHTRVQ